MLSYSVLFINKMLCTAEAFSGIWTKLLEQKLVTIKKNNLKFGTNFENLGLMFPKRIFLVQNKRIEHRHKIPQIWISRSTKFHLKQAVLSQIYPKKVFLVQNRANENYHRIQHIWIILRTKFHLEQLVLIFWAKFVLKGYFQFKIEKLNITIEFSIFELD